MCNKPIIQQAQSLPAKSLPRQTVCFTPEPVNPYHCSCPLHWAPYYKNWGVLPHVKIPLVTEYLFEHCYFGSLSHCQLSNNGNLKWDTEGLVPSATKKVTGEWFWWLGLLDIDVVSWPVFWGLREIFRGSPGKEFHKWSATRSDRICPFWFSHLLTFPVLNSFPQISSAIREFIF